MDARPSGTEWNIYAQRINITGNPVWASGGVPVCQLSGDELWPMMVYDWDGSIIMAILIFMHRLFHHLSLIPLSGGNCPSSIIWNTTDDFGCKLPLGVYFVQLEADDYKETKKVVMVR